MPPRTMLAVNVTLSTGAPQPTPQPDPDNTPSERRQQQLQEQQRRNTIERNLRNNGPDVPGGGPQQPYPKPW